MASAQATQPSVQSFAVPEATNPYRDTKPATSGDDPQFVVEETLQVTGRDGAATNNEKAAQTTLPSDEEGSNEEGNSRSIRGVKWVLVCAALYISIFLYGLDTTIAADVQGVVVEEFGDVDELAWIGAGLPMGSVAVILLVGNLYGNFNMKWVYICSIAIFELGSVLCGAAPNMAALIVGRVIAGIGGSGVYLGGLNYFSAMTKPRERGTYITLIGFHWGMGAVLGPVIGGAFSVSSATWRWAFYINLVIGAVAAPIFLFYLPPILPAEAIPLKTRLARFDFVGIVLSAGIWVSFTLAFTMAGGQWSWKDGRTIATLVIMAVLLGVYVLQQYFAIFTTKDTQAFPGHLLRSRTQVLLYIATAASVTSLYVIVYFIPIYFQFVHNDSAILAAVRLLPYIFITISVNLLVGRLLTMIKFYMPIYLVSGVLATISGALLMVFLKPSTPEANIYGFTIVAAVGTGLTIQVSYAVATLTAAPRDMGNAISMQNVSQIGGSVIALVIAGQVFQSAAVANLRVVLAGHGFSDQDIHNTVVGAQSTLLQQLSGDLRDRAIQAIVSAMQKPFILLIVSGAVLIVTSIAMKRERLFGQIVVV